ncbi:MAG: orotidine-5'-phosphate decarboxylase [Acidobacteria bacterium]|nr:orotidine-5'-phosphate decarboxylase [Acidobacteriota bacterium]
MKERLVVALDRSSRDEILALANALHGAAGMLKIGLQAYVANGPSIVRALVDRGEKVFLDLKFHDIPNTASHAVAEARKLGASIVNVHASGGAAMMRACRDAMPRGEGLLLGVTILTSLGDDDLAAVGYRDDSEASVLRLARLAQDAGLDGVVASPREIAAIRKACGSDFIIMTPGIRGAADESDDQKRTMSASAAVATGANYVVVGRPITEASDPHAAAAAVWG